MIITPRAFVLAIGLSLVACTSATLPTPAPTAAIATPTPSSLPTATPTQTTTPTPTATSAAPVVAVACGSVTGYASDGAQMLLTLGSLSGSVTTQYRLEYQFASSRPPTDIGDRLSARTEQLILVYGRQVPAEAGAATAVNLRDFTATRVTGCSTTTTVAPAAFTGLVPPTGCGYAGATVLAADHSDRFVDCGTAGNRDARGTLAPALTQQGWTLCGSGVAAATWAKGATMIGISESSLAPGDFPRLTQRARSAGNCP